MKSLVFGGNGRLGQVLVAQLKSRGAEVEAPSRADCDLSVRGAALSFVRDSEATHVFNCAAISSLEGCADERGLAVRVNVNAPFEMALACCEKGIRFVHISTDYVLNGELPGVKDENAALKPISVYAWSKAEAERTVLDVCPSALVVRVSWLCGNPARPAFVEQTVAKLMAGEPLSAISDKYSLPTDVEELAPMLVDAAATNLDGVVQACASGEPVSWYDMAERAVRAARGIRPDLAEPVIRRQELGGIPFFRERRPHHTAMSNARLAKSGFRFSSVDATIANAVARFLVKNLKPNWSDT